MKKTLTILCATAATALGAVTMSESLFERRSAIAVQGYHGVEELTDMPVLVRLRPGNPIGFTYADTAADGADIRFADAEGNLLSHEIEVWDPEGESHIWVKLPKLTAETRCFLYWKARVKVLPYVDKAQTWSAYEAVWHMHEYYNGGIVDATGNGHTANGGSPTKITGDSEAIPEPCAVMAAGATEAANLDLGTTFTLIGWLRAPTLPDPASGFYGVVWGEMGTEAWRNNNQGWYTEISQSDVILRLYGGGSNVYVDMNTEKSMRDEWLQLTMVANAGTGKLFNYLNGGEKSVSLNRTLNYSGMAANLKNLKLGHAGLRMDEVRVARQAMSDERIRAEYETIAKADYLSYAMATAIPQTTGPLVVGPDARIQEDGCSCNFTFQLASTGFNAESVDVWYARTRANGMTNEYTLVKEGWRGAGSPLGIYDYLPVESEIKVFFRFVNNLGVTSEVQTVVTTAPEVAAEYGAAGVWEYKLSGYSNWSELTDTQRHSGIRKTTFSHAYATDISTYTTYSYTGYFYLTPGIWKFYTTCDDNSLVKYYTKNRQLLGQAGNGGTLTVEVTEETEDWYYMDFRFSNNGGAGGSSDGARYWKPNDSTTYRFKELSGEFCRSDLDYWLNINNLEKSADGTEVNAILEYYALTNVTLKAVYGDAYFGIADQDAVTLIESAASTGRVSVAVKDIPSWAKYMRFFAIPHGMTELTDFIWGKTILLPDVEATMKPTVALVRTEMTSDATCDIYVNVLSTGETGSCGVYVAYGLSPDNLFATNFLADAVTETGEIKTFIAGLMADRDYYLRLFARDANGDNWSDEIFVLNTAYDSESTYGGRLGLIQCRYANRTQNYGDYDFYTGASISGSSANANDIVVAPGPMAGLTGGNGSFLIGPVTYYVQGPTYSYIGYTYLTTNAVYDIRCSYDDFWTCWVDGIERKNATFLWSKPSGWYEIKFWFDDRGGGSGGASSKLAFTETIDQQPTSYTWRNTNDKIFFRADRPPRECSVTDFDAEEGNLNVRLWLEKYDTNTLVYCCSGPLAAGTQTGNWERVELIGDYDLEKQGIEYTVGSIEGDGVRAARFATWQASRGFGWSSTISLGDAANPALSPTITPSALALGDDVSINGTLLASGEREGVTVTVYWATDAAKLAAGEGQSAYVTANENTGEWSVELTPIPPATEIFYYVEATKGARNDRSSIRSFTSRGASRLSWETECLNLSQRILTFRGSLSELGARDTKVKLWLGRDYAAALPVAELIVNENSESTAFEFTYDVSGLFGFDEDFVYYFTTENEVPSLSPQKWTDETIARETQVLDLCEYRWTGGGTSDHWTDRGNWTNLTATVTDAMGYPCNGSKASFPSSQSNEVYRICLDASQRVRELDLSATNLEVRLYSTQTSRPKFEVTEEKTAAERVVGKNSSLAFERVDAVIAGGITLTSDERFRPSRLFVEDAIVAVHGETLTWGYPVESGVWISGVDGCYKTERYYAGSESGSNYVCNAVFSVPIGGYRQYALQQLDSGVRPFGDAGSNGVRPLVTILESSPAYDNDGISHAKIIDWGCNIQPTRINLSEYPDDYTICDTAEWYYMNDPTVVIQPTSDFRYLGYTIDGHYHLRPWIYNVRITAVGQSTAMVLADIRPARGKTVTKLAYYFKPHSSTDLPLRVELNQFAEGEVFDYSFVISGFNPLSTYDFYPEVYFEESQDEQYEWSSGEYITFTTAPENKQENPALVVYEDDVAIGDFGIDIPWDCSYAGKSGKELYVHYQWTTNANAFALGGEPEYDQVQTVDAGDIPFGETAKIRFYPEEATWYVRVLLVNHNECAATSQVYIVNCPDPEEETGGEVSPESPTEEEELGNVIDWSCAAATSVTRFPTNALKFAKVTYTCASTTREGKMDLSLLTDGNLTADAYMVGNNAVIRYDFDSPHTLYRFRICTNNWGNRRRIDVSAVEVELSDGTTKKISPRSLSYDVNGGCSATLEDQNGLVIAHGVTAIIIRFGGQQSNGVHYSEIEADATPEDQYLVDAPARVIAMVALDNGTFNCCVDRTAGGQLTRARVYAYYTDNYSLDLDEWTGPYPVGYIEENTILEDFDIPACRYVRFEIVPLNEDGSELPEISMLTRTAFTDNAYRFTGDSQRRALHASVHREREFNAIPVDAYVAGNGMYAGTAIVCISTPCDDATAPVITNVMGVSLNPPQVVHARLTGLKPNTAYMTTFNTKSDDLGLNLLCTTPPDRSPDDPISEVNRWEWARWDSNEDFVNRENPFPGTYNCAYKVQQVLDGGSRPYNNQAGPWSKLTDGLAPRSGNDWNGGAIGVYSGTILKLTFLRYQDIRGIRLWTYNGDGRANPGVNNVQYQPVGSSNWYTLPYTRNVNGASGIGNVITLKPLKDREFLCTNAAAIRITGGTSWGYSDFMCWQELEVFGTISDGMARGELAIQEVTRRGTEVTATIVQQDEGVVRHANIYALWGDAPASAAIDDWEDYQFVGEMREGDRMATVTFEVGKKTGAIRFVTIPTSMQDEEVEFEALASWSPTFYLMAEEDEKGVDPIISFANIYPAIPQGLPYTLALDDLGTGASFADLRLVSVRDEDGYTVTNAIAAGGWEEMRGRRDAVAAGLRYDRTYTGYFICTNDIGGFARYPAEAENDFRFGTAADDFQGPLDTTTTNWWQGAGWTTFTPMATSGTGGFKNLFRGISATYVDGSKPYNNQAGPWPRLSDGAAPRYNDDWNSTSLGVYSGTRLQWALAEASSIKEFRFWFYNGNFRATLGVTKIEVQHEDGSWRTLPYSSYTYGTDGVGNMAYFRPSDAEWLAVSVKAVRVTFGGYSDFHCCQEVECWGRSSVGVRRHEVAFASFLYDSFNSAISYRLDRSATGNAEARVNVYACYGDTGAGAVFGDWEQRVLQGVIKAGRTTFSGRVTGLPATTTNIRWALVPVDDDGTEFPELTSWTETRYIHDQLPWLQNEPHFAVVAREAVYATSARWATELFAWGNVAATGKILADYTTDPNGFENETFTTQELCEGESAFGSQTPTLVALNPQTTYYVRLYAVNNRGEKSAYSPVESFTTTAPTVFAGSVTGGVAEETTDGDDRVIQFKNTGTATFAVTSSGYAELLVIGGGGSGGAQIGGGGKGAAFSYLPRPLVASGNYTVTVGAGGAQSAGGNQAGKAGGASSFGSVLSSAGGGGGDAFSSRTSNHGGAGAGGAGANGYTSIQNSNERWYYCKGGDGGIGKPSAITGLTEYYAAGGGGGSYNSNMNWEGLGGHGGGGRGYSQPSAVSAEHVGQANTGSGGGGGNNGTQYGGAGGSGTVVLRYTPLPDEPSVPAVALVEVMGDVCALEVEANVVSCGGDRCGKLTLAYGTDPDHLDHELVLAERMAEGMRRFDVAGLKGARRYFCKVRFTKESGGYAESRILSAETSAGVDVEVDPGAPRFKGVSLVTNRVDYTELAGFVQGVEQAEQITIAIGEHLETMLEMDCGAAELGEMGEDGYRPFRVYATTNLVPNAWYVVQARAENADGRDGSTPIDYRTHQLVAAISYSTLSNLQDAQNTSGYTHDNGRDIQFEVTIGHLGAGENLLELWIGDTNDPANMERAVVTLADKVGNYNVHWVAPDWSTVNQTRYFQFRLVHSFEGETYTLSTEVRTFQLRDARTYAWTGEGPAPKRWSDPRNWKSSNADCYGYPTYWSWVQFDGCPVGTVDTCVLDRDQSVYMFRMNGTGRDITITSEGETARTITMWPPSNYYNPGSFGIWAAATSRWDHARMSVSGGHGLHFNDDSYLQLDHGAYLYHGGGINFNQDKSYTCTLELCDRSYFQFAGDMTAYNQYGRSWIIIDDSTLVSTAGNFYWSSSNPEYGVIAFRGKNPVAKISSLNCYNRNGYFQFEVPVGGFTEPPYQGYNGGNGTRPASNILRYRVSTNSPAIKVPGWTETPLFEHAVGFNTNYIKIEGEGSNIYMADALGSDYTLSWGYGRTGFHSSWSTTVSGNPTGIRLRFCAMAHEPTIGRFALDDLQYDSVQMTGFVSPGESQSTLKAKLYVGEVADGNEVGSIPDRVLTTYGDQTYELNGLLPGSNYVLRLELAGTGYEPIVSNFTFQTFSDESIFTLGAHTPESEVIDHGPFTIWTFEDELGTFTMDEPSLVEILLVGGGGAGGYGGGGGGGGGGLYWNDEVFLDVGTYSFTVGRGGSINGGNGGDSRILNEYGKVIASVVGGGGGGSNGGGGQVGGSGGGGTRGNGGGAAIPGQGNAGGKGATNAGAGGGGAGAPGTAAGTGAASGTGGDGRAIDIYGAPRYFAGGGAGSQHDGQSKYNHSGGLGGGGDSVMYTTGNPGMDGFGGGGAGGYWEMNGSRGGNGTFVIRMRTKSAVDPTPQVAYREHLDVKRGSIALAWERFTIGTGAESAGEFLECTYEGSEQVYTNEFAQSIEPGVYTNIVEGFKPGVEWTCRLVTTNDLGYVMKSEEFSFTTVSEELDYGRQGLYYHNLANRTHESSKWTVTTRAQRDADFAAGRIESNPTVSYTSQTYVYSDYNTLVYDGWLFLEAGTWDMYTTGGYGSQVELDDFAIRGSVNGWKSPMCTQVEPGWRKIEIRHTPNGSTLNTGGNGFLLRRNGCVDKIRPYDLGDGAIWRTELRPLTNDCVVIEINKETQGAMAEVNARLRIVAQSEIPIYAGYGYDYSYTNREHGVAGNWTVVDSGLTAADGTNDYVISTMVPANTRYIRYYAMSYGIPLWSETVFLRDVEEIGEEPRVRIVGVENAAGGEADVRVAVMSTGRGAAEVELAVEWQEQGETVKTNVMTTVTEAKHYQLHLDFLRPGREYTIRIVSENENDADEGSEPYYFKTAGYNDLDGHDSQFAGLWQNYFSVSSSTSWNRTMDPKTGRNTAGEFVGRAEATVVPGARIAGNGYTFNWVTYDNPPDNYSYGYAGYMYMTNNTTYTFGDQWLYSSAHIINGYTLMSRNGSGTGQLNGSYRNFGRNGWYPVKFWLGGASGWGKPYDQYANMGFGMGFNTEGLTVGGSSYASRWHKPWNLDGEEPLFYANKPGRRIKVTARSDEGGAITADLELEEWDSATALYACWGAADGGDRMADWEHCDFVQMVDGGETSVTGYSFPAAAKYARFFLRGSDTESGFAARSVYVEAQRGKSVELRCSRRMDGTYRTATLYLVYGKSDRGNITNGWQKIVKVADIAGDTDTYTATLPEEAGSTYPYVRFILMTDVSSSFGYATDGLVAHWDGVDNTGSRGEHDSASTVWRDLVGGREFTLHGATWSDDGVEFVNNASTSYGELSAEDTQATFEAVPDGTLEMVVFFGNKTANNIALASTSTAKYGLGTSSGWGGGMITTSSGTSRNQLWSGSNDYFKNKHYTLTLMYSGHLYRNGAGAYIDGGRFVMSGQGWDASIAATKDNKTYIGRDGGSNGYLGKICAIRFYNRNLTEAEIYANSLLDRLRFGHNNIGTPTSAHMRTLYYSSATRLLSDEEMVTATRTLVLGDDEAWRTATLPSAYALKLSLATPDTMALTAAVTDRGSDGTVVTAVWGEHEDELQNEATVAQGGGAFATSIGGLQRGHTYYVQLVSRNVRDGVEYTRYGEIESITVNEQVDYTWTGAAGDGDWRNRGNWSASEPQCFGYPSSSLAGAIFTNMAGSVTLPFDLSIGRLVFGEGATKVVISNAVLTATSVEFAGEGAAKLVIAGTGRLLADKVVASGERDDELCLVLDEELPMAPVVTRYSGAESKEPFYGEKLPRITIAGESKAWLNRYGGTVTIVKWPGAGLAVKEPPEGVYLLNAIGSRYTVGVAYGIAVDLTPAPGTTLRLK